jgi:hypothetical protein
LLLCDRSFDLGWGEGFSKICDNSYQRSYRLFIPLLQSDTGKRSRKLGFNRNNSFLRLNFIQWIANSEGFTLLLEPSENLTLLHRLPQAREMKLMQNTPPQKDNSAAS